MFCKHEWKVLSEVTTKSKLDQLNAGGLSNLRIHNVKNSEDSEKGDNYAINRDTT